MADGTVIDGEVIALDADGRPSFNILQNNSQLPPEREVLERQRPIPAREDRHQAKAVDELGQHAQR